MALTRLLFSSFLLTSSLMLVISFANYDYRSTQYLSTIDQCDHKQTLLNHDQLLNNNLISTNDHNQRYDHGRDQDGLLHDQVLGPTTKDPYEHQNSEGKEAIITVKSKNFYEKSNPGGKENKIVDTKLPYHGEQDEGVLIPANKFIAVQGLILCNSGQKYAPLQGAKARITCEIIEDKNGFEDPKSFSIETDETDINGLFLETFSISYIREVKLNVGKCKVFLEAPPPKSTCTLATDANSGIKGAMLSSVRILNDKILYTVGPFVYTSSYSFEYKPAGRHPNYQSVVPGGY